ncbi:MAG: sigma-70 family RNA polymerase sigma factor [Firmicutes bacterium]|nr:sigma-70 family RNA polymerase sigma factor [[Eubacterium] siraeum]MCM1488783.1 sigma-70 family RNA polymerase sigma factor [Bacillota bacterium]
MNEQETIEELQRGSGEALHLLIDKYTAYVSSIIYHIIGYRREDCSELTADVFIALWNNRNSLVEGKLKSYIGAIARNKAFNFVRGEKEALPLDEEILFQGDTPEEYLEKRDAALMLKKALSGLDPLKKELLLRYYFYGQKVVDAAAEMKIKNSTAKVWLKRGRDELREILKKEGFEL